LQGKLKLKAILWIWQYRLIFWVRSGWRRNLLLKHPLLLEKVGHFFYRFPSTIPGYTLITKLRRFLINLLNQDTDK